MTTALNVNGTTPPLVPPTPILCEKCRCQITTGLLFDNHQVRYLGKVLPFTAGERKVINLLYTHADTFLTYRAIYDVVQSPGFIAGADDDGFRGNVRSFIKRLRRKFAASGAPDVIENLTGVGYRWKGDAR